MPLTFAQGKLDYPCAANKPRLAVKWQWSGVKTTVLAGTPTEEEVFPQSAWLK